MSQVKTTAPPDLHITSSKSDVTLTAGATINVEVDIHPLVVSVATGYRF